MPELTAYLGVPTRGLVDTDVAQGIDRLAMSLGLAPVYQRGHVSAGMTRNQIVAKFLATGRDVLVMVDDDVYPSELAHRLVGRIGEGWDVAAGAYPIFKPERGWPLPVPAVFEEENGDYGLAMPQPDGMQEVAAVGTGCVAIGRRVLEELEMPFGEMMSGDQVVSDDFVFCQQARAAGFRIGVDWGVRCDHLCRVSLGSILAGVNAKQQRPALVRV